MAQSRDGAKHERKTTSAKEQKKGNEGACRKGLREQPTVEIGGKDVEWHEESSELTSRARKTSRN